MPREKSLSLDGNSETQSNIPSLVEKALTLPPPLNADKSLEQSTEGHIIQFLMGLNSIKQQLHADISPQVTGERELSDRDFNFEWVFDTLLRGRAHWYGNFWGLVDIAEKRGVASSRLQGDGRNIFDQFADRYSKIAGDLSKQLASLGFQTSEKQRFDVFIRDRRHLKPEEITNQFMGLFPRVEEK